MSRLDVQNRLRLKWLTKAVRALLVKHYGGTRGYDASISGQQDAMLKKSEDAYSGAEQALQNFLNEPDEAKARKKLDELLRGA